MALLSRVSLPRSAKVLLFSLYTITILTCYFKFKSYQILSQTSNERIEFSSLLVPFLQLIPRYTLSHPWVLVTAIFTEISYFTLLISTVILFYGSKYCEKCWGFKETLKFVTFVGSLTNLWTVLTTIILNLITGDVAGMDRPLGGGISYYVGFLVVLKQLIPEHNLILFKGALNLRIKHVPFIILVISTLWSILFQRIYPAIPSWGSFLFSWIYLRFIQSTILDPILPTTIPSSSTSQQIGLQRVTGDASDAFALVEFFPDIMKPWIGKVFNQIYDLCCTLDLITPFNDELIQQSNMRASSRVGRNSSSSSNVAERRRQVALQVIEDRINNANK